MSKWLCHLFPLCSSVEK